jgi:hypothetical protein
MQRNESTNRTEDKLASGKDGATDKATGVTGSAILARWQDMVQEEIAIPIESQGGTLPTGTSLTYPDDYNQLNRYGTRAGTGHYGDGSDGDVTLGSNTTLTRDMYYNSLAMGGYTITTAGHKIFVAEAITGTGTIRSNGAAGGDFSTGYAGGSGGSSSTVNGGSDGGDGANGGVGNNGTAVTNGMGDIGGDGGLNGGNAGGSAGTFANPIASFGSIRDLAAARNAEVQGAGGSAFVYGGSGGGGGADSGGGGGGGGGVVVVAARNIGAGVVLEAKGGDGGDADVGAGGGGGGGGGGVAIVICRTMEDAAWTAVDVSAGSGGSGISGGANGSDGSDGLKLRFYA